MKKAYCQEQIIQIIDISRLNYTENWIRLKMTNNRNKNECV